jgi:hypothetical protein
MQRHLLQQHLHLQQPSDQLRRSSCCRRAWHTPPHLCQRSSYAAGTRLAALPVQPSTAGQDQQQQKQQQDGHQQDHNSSSSSSVVKLVEVQDRRRTTYSWQPSSSSSNGSSVTVRHEQQQDEQDGQQLLPSLPGRQQLLDALKTLYLPAGYPNTVTGQ